MPNLENSISLSSIPQQNTEVAVNPNSISIRQRSFDFLKNEMIRNRLIQLAVDLSVIIIIFVVYGIVCGTVKPQDRYIYCTDKIFEPFIVSTIPYYAVIIYCTIGPILIIMLIELYVENLLPFQTRQLKFTWSTLIVCVYHAISLFLVGMAMTVLLTEIAKRWVSRLRPNFIAVCNPDLTKIVCFNDSIPNTIYTGNGFCRGDEYYVTQARLSFPSGHASFSAYTMVYIIIYLQARTVLYKYRYIRLLVQLAAFITAYVTALSRIRDNYHYAGDVIGGVLLGFSIALFVLFVYGKLLWYYGNVEIDYYDFELKPIINATNN